jgi:release factor glutamine methyltransferase
VLDVVRVADLLAQGAGRLAAAGLSQPRREATHLLAAVRGETPGATWLASADSVSPAAATRFEQAVEQRAHGVPFAYAAGVAAFRSLTLRLDRRALIPRPETEGLVDLALAQAARAGVTGLALDLGTGSGCIALSLAQECGGRFERVLAVELDAATGALARDNAIAVAPAVPVEVRVGDMFGPVAGLRFGLIVSNPPYLTETEYEGLEAMVRDYEPRNALVSGVDGLNATRALLDGARGALAPGGVLAFEIDERRAGAVQALAHDAGFTTTVHEDLFGKPRYALAALREDG